MLCDACVRASRDPGTDQPPGGPPIRANEYVAQNIAARSGTRGFAPEPLARHWGCDPYSCAVSPLGSTRATPSLTGLTAGFHQFNPLTSAELAISWSPGTPVGVSDGEATMADQSCDQDLLARAASRFWTERNCWVSSWRDSQQRWRARMVRTAWAPTPHMLVQGRANDCLPPSEEITAARRLRRLGDCQLQWRLAQGEIYCIGPVIKQWLNSWLR